MFSVLPVVFYIAIQRHILAGITAGHAQAATLTCLGFFVIDRLNLTPSGSEGPISIVMMAGAVATLGAQWGLIPRLGLSPRRLILWGALIAATGLICTMASRDLYGITIGFALASLGFGFTRPGFTAGASLAVPLAEQGAVAGDVDEARNAAGIFINFIQRFRLKRRAGAIGAGHRESVLDV